MDLVRVWLHESDRVYGDKLVDDEDNASFQKILTDIVKKGFEVGGRRPGGTICGGWCDGGGREPGSGSGEW